MHAERDLAGFANRLVQYQRERVEEAAAVLGYNYAEVVMSRDDHERVEVEAAVVAIAEVHCILCVAAWAPDPYLPSHRRSKAACSISSAKRSVMRAPVLVLAQATNPTPSFGNRPPNFLDSSNRDLGALLRQSDLFDPAGSAPICSGEQPYTALPYIKPYFWVSFEEHCKVQYESRALTSDR